MKTINIEYKGDTLTVSFNYIAGSKGDRDTAPTGASVELFNIDYTDKDLEESAFPFFDETEFIKLEEKVLEKYEHENNLD